jgi:hypothetical protein
LELLSFTSIYPEIAIKYVNGKPLLQIIMHKAFLLKHISVIYSKINNLKPKVSEEYEVVAK